MVRLLLIVHLNNRALPDQRADLFDKAINALLQVDYGRDESDNRELSADWTLYRDMAQQLAFRMHQQGADQGREIEEPALRAILRAEAEFPAAPRRFRPPCAATRQRPRRARRRLPLPASRLAGIPRRPLPERGHRARQPRGDALLSSPNDSRTPGGASRSCCLPATRRRTPPARRATSCAPWPQAAASALRSSRPPSWPPRRRSSGARAASRCAPTARSASSASWATPMRWRHRDRRCARVPATVWRSSAIRASTRSDSICRPTTRWVSFALPPIQGFVIGTRPSRTRRA
jgi:hypothetical protein